MSFLNIWALSIAGLVVPALLILYFLKLRRRDQVVPSTLLWKRAVQDLQVNAPFQRLRKNLLLFLQMLALLAGVVALARPMIQSTATDQKSVVVMIDRSASMNAVEKSRSRLDDAKEQAERLVRTLNNSGSRWFTFGGAPPKTRAMVIAFADRASVVAPFTSNTDDLVAAIRSIEPSEQRTNLREALELAEAHVAPTRMGVENTPISAEPTAKIVLLSDGAIPELDQLAVRGATMEMLSIGDSDDNVGITTLRVQRNYEKPELLEAFVRVQNFSAQEVSTDVSLYIDGKLQKVENIRLGPAPTAAKAPNAAGTEEDQPPAAATPAPDTGASSASISMEIVSDRSGVLEARVVRSDSFSTDNSAWAIIPPPRKMRVLVVAEKNTLTSRVLRGLPLESVKYLSPSEYEAAGDADIETGGALNYDVAIMAGCNTKRLPLGNYLFLGGLPEVEGVAPGETAENHALVWWDDAHAVLRNVLMDNIIVAKSTGIKLPDAAEVLVEGPKGPLMARLARGGRQFLILGFTPELSTWWREPGFPIFMYNAIQYLGSAASVADSDALRPGEPLKIPLPAGESATVVTAPNATSTRILAGSDGFALFGGTDHVGLYTAKPAAPGRDKYAVNLEDEWESNIAPHKRIRVGQDEIASANAIRVATPEIWRWFVGAALAVVLLEWYIYNRRVMI